MNRPLDIPVPLRAGYLVHHEADGRKTYSAVVEQVPGTLPPGRFIPQFECAVSVLDAIARAARMCDRFADCPYDGELPAVSA